MYKTILLLFSLVFLACDSNTDIQNGTSETTKKLPKFSASFSKRSLKTPINSAITFSFSKDIDMTSLYYYDSTLDVYVYGIELYKQENDGNFTKISFDEIEVLKPYKEFAMYNKAYFDANSTYKVILEDSIKTLDGVELGVDVSYTFSTGDNIDFTPPEVVHISPSQVSFNGVTEADSKTQVSVVFDEPILQNNPKFILKDQNQNTILGKFTYGNRSINFKPNNNLVASNTYKVYFTNQVQDLSQNYSQIDLNNPQHTFSVVNINNQNNHSLLYSDTNSSYTTFEANQTTLMIPHETNTSSTIDYGLLIKNYTADYNQSSNEIENFRFDDENSSYISILKQDIHNLNYQKIENSKITKIIYKDPYIFLITKADGFYIIQNNKIINHTSLNLQISDIYYDQETRLIYVGTLSDGIYEYSLNSNTPRLIKKITEATPTYALTSYSGFLYIAQGLEGVASYDMSTDSNYTKLDYGTLFAHDIEAFSDGNSAKSVVISDAQAGVRVMNEGNLDSYDTLSYAYSVQYINYDSTFVLGVVDVKNGFKMYSAYDTSNLPSYSTYENTNFTATNSDLIEAKYTHIPLISTAIVFMLNNQHELIVVSDGY